MNTHKLHETCVEFYCKSQETKYFNGYVNNLVDIFVTLCIFRRFNSFKKIKPKNQCM